MKILVIVPSYKPAYIYGGTIRVIADLCELLSSNQQDVTVYTTSANGKEELDVIPGKEYVVDDVRVFYFKRLIKGNFNYSSSLLKKLNQTIDQFDVIHIHSWWNMISIPSAIICKFRGILPIITPHGTLSAYSFSHRKSFLKFLFHQVYGKKILSTSILHAATQKEEIEIQNTTGNPKILLIPNILKLPPQVLSPFRPAGKFRILYIGRIHPVKNLEMFLEVLNKKITFPFEFIVIGDGEERYVSGLKELTLRNKSVHWAGVIDGDEKYKLLAGSDLLVLPSHTENFGNVVFESLSQGTAVLISDNVGSRDYVERNSLGWVASNTKEEWAKKLIEIFNDHINRERIRRVAPGKIAFDFNVERQARPYLDMYQQCITKQH